MANWKINCMEKKYPGLWYTWFTEQTCAVGFPPDKNGHRSKAKKRMGGWTIAHRYLRQIKPDDKVIVQLGEWQIGRIGTVLSKKIEDEDWDPTVPRQGLDQGHMGRRVQVRWDLTPGPLTPSFGVKLPPKARPNLGIWRRAISPVPQTIFRAMELASKEKQNWVSLISGFDSERALSEYVSASPHQLEDGLLPYPSKAVRELVFRDRTRLDVLLLDRGRNIVIVECKLGEPCLQHVEQLRGYMRNAKKLRIGLKTGKKIRGILEHGGSRKLSSEVRKESKRSPEIELVQFSVSVGFTPSL